MQVFADSGWAQGGVPKSKMENLQLPVTLIKPFKGGL